MIRFIEVTKKHIELGVPGDECNCAIALALQDEYKTSDVLVQVEDEPMLYVGDNILELATCETAEEIDSFITYFDNRDKVEPFTIKICERAGVWVTEKI